MDGLEHGGVPPLRVQVGARRQAHAAGDGRAQVCQDVAKQVGGDHHLEPARVLDEKHAGRIHQIGVGGHIRVFLCHLGEDLVPIHHGVIEGVAVGHRLAPAAGQLKGVAHHPLAAPAGEHARLQHHFVLLAGEQPIASAGVFPFAVFPHHHHVDVLPLDVF